MQLGNFFCIAALCLASTLQAFPTRIIVIRHGEKPPANALKIPLGTPYPYYTKSLTSEGQLRAAYLPSYFLGDPPLFPDMINQNGQPATNPITFLAAYNTGNQLLSFRPLETITPLANALYPMTATQSVSAYDSENIHKYNEDTISLVTGTTLKEDVAQQTGTAIICWKHGKIPALIAALGVPTTNLTYQQIFPNGAYPNPPPFNLTFVITYDPTTPWQVSDFVVDYQIASFAEYGQ